MTYKYGETMPSCGHLYCPLLSCRFPKEAPQAGEFSCSAPSQEGHALGFADASPDDLPLPGYDEEYEEEDNFDRDAYLDNPQLGQARGINRDNRGRG